MGEAAGLVTIGEFSRLSCITPRMLRHYDRLGILRPAVVDEHSGYRRYRLQQLDLARQVVRLRDARVPTAVMLQLAHLAPGSAEYRLVLADHRDRLVEQGQQIEAGLAGLDAWLASAQAAPLAVRRLVTEPRIVAFARGRAATYQDAAPLWRAVLDSCGLEPGALPTSLESGSICHDEEYRATDCDLEMWLTWHGIADPGEQRERDGIVTGIRELAGVDVLQVTFAGDYIGHDGIYEAIGRELAASGARIAGPTHHFHHPGPPIVADVGQWVTDVAIPIEDVPVAAA